MNYCKFQNTLEDLKDCIETAGEFMNTNDFLNSLSDEERYAAKRMIRLCREFADDFEIDD